ncbi:MAG: hypothetical protein U5K69_23385 [Balneolaceae bacterium]|nr:hypothetical protein [Balneolaceae bacterium]
MTTNADPVEGGSVIPSTDEFFEGSQIEIEAIPEQGWIFQGWEGDLEGSVNPDSITIDGDKNITARFTKSTYDLNIQIEGEGNVETEEVLTNEDEINDQILAKRHNSVSGRGSSAAIKIDEKSRPGEPDSIGESRSSNAVLKDTTQEIDKDNSTQDNHFRTVRLTAVPDDGWEFIRWEGDLEGNENPTSIVLDEDKNITAVFEPSEGSSTIEIVTQPSQTSAGAAISPAPELRILDGDNNPIEGVDVTVSEQEGFSLGGTVTATTGTEGRVAFSDLVIQQAGSYTLVFSAEEISGQATSNTFDIVAAAGDPAQTTATVPGGSAGSPTTISITVEDPFGNRVSGASGNLSVSVQ